MSTPKRALKLGYGTPDPNYLHLGDNLAALRDLIPDESVDLVYLDPPFNTNMHHSALRRDSGKTTTLRIRGFSDVWRWNPDSEAQIAEWMNDRRTGIGDLILSFQRFLGRSQMMAYLTMMTPRLQQLHRVLKPSGSIFLHCDPGASHYLKLLMDAIFGINQFQNEIVWSYKSGGATSRRFSRKHDIILFYSKDRARLNFNPLREKSYNRKLKPYHFKGVREYRDEVGWFTMVNMKDVWQMDMVGRTSRERTGYPTQKPEALLERIILAGTKEGELVLDPFCGSGTTLAVAERLDRRWIGIDSNEDALLIASKRIEAIRSSKLITDNGSDRK